VGMTVLIRGNDNHVAEFAAKFPDIPYDIDLDYKSDIELESYPFIFDYYVDESPDNLNAYKNYDGVLLLNSVKSSLLEYSSYLGHISKGVLVGFNGLPTFFNREVLECTVLNESGSVRLKEAAEFLGFNYVTVDDRIGMVTPRVIFMIINEAYYTCQEGTATKEAIDQAMKLGTNYPFGPFEWTQRVGIVHVYELLDAVYQDTHDERYKICPMLKKEYLESI